MDAIIVARENPRMDEVIGFFPTPLLRVTRAFDDALVRGLGRTLQRVVTQT